MLLLPPVPGAFCNRLDGLFGYHFTVIIVFYQKTICRFIEIPTTAEKITSYVT